MKLRRSSRIVDMTRYLLQHPHQIIQLTFFAERFESAKSSISEDLVIVKESFETQGVGYLETIPGAAGGVKFIPAIHKSHAKDILNDLREKLQAVDRLLPGGYLFVTDILGDPQLMNEVGRMIATIYAFSGVDVIMTMETKGIPIAYAAAAQLNVPVVIVRKSSRITEGSTVSINYVSGSSKRIQTMVLTRRSIKPNAKVLIIDDFMKAGGTIKGMTNLVAEFEAKTVGIAVLIETSNAEPKLVTDYLSLLKISEAEDRQGLLIDPGNFFQLYEEVHNEKNTHK